jgi:hypothetical protein
MLNANEEWGMHKIHIKWDDEEGLMMMEERTEEEEERRNLNQL